MSQTLPAIGVDLGGTKIAAGLVAADGTLLSSESEPTPGDVTKIPAVVGALVERLTRDQAAVGVGIGAAGFVDADRATVRFAPNIDWVDEPLAARVTELVNLPVVVENDANAAAWGEFRFGAGEDVDDLLLVTLGTGVGGGVVHRGSLFRGAFGVAAEIGHLRLVPDGVLCGCGQHGCFEQYASGSALVREALARVEAGEHDAAALAELAGTSGGINGPAITQLAHGGDALSIRLLADLRTVGRRRNRQSGRDPRPRGHRHRRRGLRCWRPDSDHGDVSLRGAPLRSGAPTTGRAAPGHAGQHRRHHRRG